MHRLLLSCLILLASQSTFLKAEQLNHRVFPDGWTWTSITDKAITTEGNWIDDRFRFADAAHKYTTQNNASIIWQFTGSSLIVRLAGQNTSSYPGTGLPSHGKLSVYIDGILTKEIYPAQHGREFIAATNLSDKTHQCKLVHSVHGEAAGVRVEGFLTTQVSVGLYSVAITAELQEYLNDARITVSKNNELIRTTIGRNWLTGTLSIALPANDSFDVRIEALGWSSHSLTTSAIQANQINQGRPVYLYRDPQTVKYRFRYPALNNQAIRRPGGEFTARFLGFDTTIKEVRITRSNGEATFTRKLSFKEDTTKAFYYDRQLDLVLPDDTPPGVYDLEIDIEGGRRTSTCKSPSSVVIVNKYPKNPKFVTFGHLDTSGQFQAEYMQRIASIANIIGADMVLASNSVNAAYISGALSRLRIPYVVNFGNHQVFGHHRWYGSDLGAVSFGSDLLVLNYGLAWHEPVEPVLAILEQHRSKPIKVINAFEHNAPESVLDDFRIALIHDAHGPGLRVTDMGSTPTRRVGKSNSISFRLVEFLDGKVVSATYKDHPTAPFPFARDEVPPVRIEMKSPTEAIVINEYEKMFVDGQVTFLVPAGSYSPTAGTVKSISISDDRTMAEIIISVDLKPNSKTTIELIAQ